MQEKKQTSAVTKWMTLIIVAIAGGLMTKLPYLRETYMVPLQEATGATKTQLGLIMLTLSVISREVSWLINSVVRN
jgi:hypothetical protein